jgi:hypothetical protein
MRRLPENGVLHKTDGLGYQTPSNCFDILEISHVWIQPKAIIQLSLVQSPHFDGM